MSPRWQKLWRDILAERSRYGLMLLAVIVSLVALGSVLGVRDVMRREMARNYLGTRPAHATLELPGGVTPAALALVLGRPEVEHAEAGDVLQARAQVNDDWVPVLLFVVDDFAHVRLNRFTPGAAPFPPPRGTALMERSATGVLATGAGGRLNVRLPGGDPVTLPIAGLVHDPSLAPAWQERAGYLYVDRATASMLGADALHELRLRFRDLPETLPAIEAAAAKLAARLAAAGHAVSEIRVPPPRRHPHQTQMETVLLLLLVFSLLALVLSGVLTATTLSALLMRQTREIAVMKTLGARSSQLLTMYASLIALLGLLALLVAAPLSALGLRPFARGIATMLNLELQSLDPGGWVFVAQALAAILVPLAIASVPVWLACRVTVRDAMDRHGVGDERIRQISRAWPAVWRTLARRPGRLAMTLGLLTAGGAMFMTALNVSSSWDKTIDKVYATRHYDIEVRSAGSIPPDLARRVADLPGVRQVEAWARTDAAFARAGRIDVSHAYPDRGHGTTALMAPPPGDRMVSFPVLRGRWLRDDGNDSGIVLNHAAALQAGQPKIGDDVMVSLDGVLTRWPLIGVVEEIGAAGVAYVSPAALTKVAPAAAEIRVLRISSDAPDAAQRAQHIQALDRTLTGWGVAVQSVRPLSELRTAMGDHIKILIRALISLAAVMGIVGGLGLAAAMSMSVLERSRELAVMKTLGATPARLVRMVMQEAGWLAVASWGLAWLASLPLTWLLDGWIGQLGFVAPLPFSLSGIAAGGWLLSALILAGLAAFMPAAAAGRSPIATALQAV